MVITQLYTSHASAMQEYHTHVPVSAPEEDYEDHQHPLGSGHHRSEYATELQNREKGLLRMCEEAYNEHLAKWRVGREARIAK